MNLTVVESEEAPLRLQLGADCVARVETELRTIASELRRRRELAVSTPNPATGDW